MKTRLLLTFLLFCFFSLSSQTTHNLDWFTNIGSNVDLTINSGDTVVWTWTSPNHTVENDPFNSVETFDSGFLGPNGSTFSWTFTVVGANDYFCGVHGATSMSGTITVEPPLSVDEDSLTKFSISPNPASERMQIVLPSNMDNAKLKIYNVLGKQVISKDISRLDSNLDIRNWNKGIYIVRLSSEGVVQTKRFVKQ